jgi:putative addiction module component (TIGR02574 family)
MSTDWLFDLTATEKLRLREEFWNALVATSVSISIHEWQKDELAKRKSNLLRKPSSAITWDEVTARIRSRRGS